MKILNFFLMTVVLLFAGTALAFEPIVFQDPTGDDKGPGTFVYPTNSVYKSGSFDLTKVKITDEGADVKFEVTLKSRITDPWDSKGWTPPGNGFSLQFVQIYVDTDHKAGSGHKKGLPGLNVALADESAWEKVVVISPQPASRIKMETKMKAKEMAADVVVPKKVKVKGKRLIVSVPKKDLGAPQKGWGWQVVVQSNEGYPDANDLLTRDVNEIEGDHRFGGGSDWDCDPHVLDMLVGKAAGEAGEAKEQYDALKYTCAGSDTAKAKLAILPLLYR